MGFSVLLWIKHGSYSTTAFNSYLILVAQSSSAHANIKVLPTKLT